MSRLFTTAPRKCFKIRCFGDGNAVTKNARKSTIQCLLFLWFKNARKYKGLALFSLTIINAKKYRYLGL